MQYEVPIDENVFMAVPLHTYQKKTQAYLAVVTFFT